PGPGAPYLPLSMAAASPALMVLASNAHGDVRAGPDDVISPELLKDPHAGSSGAAGNSQSHLHRHSAFGAGAGSFPFFHRSVSGSSQSSPAHDGGNISAPDSTSSTAGLCYHGNSCRN